MGVLCYRVYQLHLQDLTRWVRYPPRYLGAYVGTKELGLHFQMTFAGNGHRDFEQEVLIPLSQPFPPLTHHFLLSRKLESKVHAGLGSRSLQEIKLLKENNRIFLSVSATPEQRRDLES